MTKKIAVYFADLRYFLCKRQNKYIYILPFAVFFLGNGKISPLKCVGELCQSQTVFHLP